MKVNLPSNMGLYKQGNTRLSLSEKTAAKNRGYGKMDVSEFSRGGTTLSGKSAASIKMAVLQQVGTAADSGRLEELRASIKNGTYQVSTQDLVDAILNS